MSRLLSDDEILQRLEQAFREADDVYIPPGVSREAYLSELIGDVREHQCEPTLLNAIVMSPGFPDVAEGEPISGICVAKRDGYWLVFDEQRDRFCAFWGENPALLGAHGVFGSPLYCWTA